ncbi:MAG: 6,7-dimethyl-8-ribityllumazine synthase [Candidatus Micrarchaeota archaeon]
MNIAIVRSLFNEEITGKMERAAVASAKKNGAVVKTILRVPGAFDMPLALDKALSKRSINAVAAIGAIIKGDTKHDEVIAFSLAKTIHELELKHKKPIGLGVTGPGISWEQAEERAEDYAERAVEAAIALWKLQKNKK